MAYSVGVPSIVQEDTDAGSQGVHSKQENDEPGFSLLAQSSCRHSGQVFLPQLTICGSTDMLEVRISEQAKPVKLTEE